MFKKSGSPHGFGCIAISALIVALVAAAFVPSTPANGACSLTDDPRIRDCSPTIETFSPRIGENSERSVSGKMLSLAVSADGQRLYTGAYSGVWRSDDAGKTWKQLKLPQPPPSTDEVPGALTVPNIFDLAVSARDKDVVLAAAATAVAGFPDTLVPEHSKNGIYLSENGGESWRLVHQFECQRSAGTQPVGQVVFAPDNPRLVYAAGGCSIAISRDEGKTWTSRLIREGTNEGTVWHVAVAPLAGSFETGFIRRVYAAGQDQIWYSQDAGTTWFKDTSSNLPTGDKRGTPGFPIDFPGFGGSTCEGGTCSSARILAVEPGRPDHVYLAVPGVANGPRYYAPAPDGTPCNTGPNTGPQGCGDGSLWLGNYSAFFSAGRKAEWRQLPGPPSYFGGSTPSGRTYVITHPLRATPRTRPYLLFFSDISHVHMSFGRPHVSAGRLTSNSWYRLDGRNVSQAEIDNERCNRLFVHVDPHVLVVSPDFNIRLKPAEGVAFPYDRNSVVDESFPATGTIWMANDGGVYLNSDFRAPSRIDVGCDSPRPSTTDIGVSWKLGDKLATLQLPSPFAGVSIAGKPPALYFGTPDNDDYFSLDAGTTWNENLTIQCGDCGAWFADPAQPNRVLEFDRGPRVVLYINPEQNSYPDPGFRRADDSGHFSFTPLPLPDPFASARALAGYRPLVLTLKDETAPSDADFILVDVNSRGNRALLRTTKLSQITDPAEWKATTMENAETVKVFQQGPDFNSAMVGANIVQAAGGHNATVFYVGDRTRLWRCAGECVTGRSSWQQIVPTDDGSTKMAQRFFANPYDADEIYIIAEDAIKRSVNGGSTWHVDETLDKAVTENGRFRYEVSTISNNSNSTINAVIRDMVFVRDEATRFAVGNAGVFFSLNGTNWERLLSTRALPGHPAGAYFDPISDPSDRALYVGFDGRGLLRIAPIPAP